MDLLGAAATEMGTSPEFSVILRKLRNSPYESLNPKKSSCGLSIEA